MDFANKQYIDFYISLPKQKDFPKDIQIYQVLLRQRD